MRLNLWSLRSLFYFEKSYREPNLKVDRARPDNDPGNLKMSAPMKST